MQRGAVDENVGELLPGVVVDHLGGGAGDLHIGGALLLREVLVVDEADGFVFVHGQSDGGDSGGGVFRSEAAGLRKTADLPAFPWSWHGGTPFDSFWHTPVSRDSIPQFWVYVNNFRGIFLGGS